jgi:hypothetical protein
MNMGMKDIVLPVFPLVETQNLCGDITQMDIEDA